MPEVSSSNNSDFVSFWRATIRAGARSEVEFLQLCAIRFRLSFNGGAERELRRMNPPWNCSAILPSLSGCDLSQDSIERRNGQISLDSFDGESNPITRLTIKATHDLACRARRLRRVPLHANVRHGAAGLRVRPGVRRK